MFRLILYFIQNILAQTTWMILDIKEIKKIMTSFRACFEWVSWELIGLNVSLFIFTLHFPHSNHVTSSQRVDTFIYHTIMSRNSINFLYNLEHMTLWCLEVVAVVYARVYFSFPIIVCHLYLQEMRHRDFDHPNLIRHPWISFIPSSDPHDIFYTPHQTSDYNLPICIVMIKSLF